jgi:hypothetical protein
MIFSVTSASCAARATSKFASESPPIVALSLWHVAQYFFITPLWSGGAGWCELTGLGAARPTVAFCA